MAIFGCIYTVYQSLDKRSELGCLCKRSHNVSQAEVIGHTSRPILRLEQESPVKPKLELSTILLELFPPSCQQPRSDRPFHLDPDRYCISVGNGSSKSSIQTELMSSPQTDSSQRIPLVSLSLHRITTLSHLASPVYIAAGKWYSQAWRVLVCFSTVKVV